MLVATLTNGRVESALGLFPDARVDLPMPDNDSISEWIDRLKTGDELAAQRIWERYFERLARLVYQRLLGSARRASDEEDVALSAFAAFCRGAGQGRFPKVSDRDDLWRILIHIAEGKLQDNLKHEGRQKRGGGLVRGDSAWQKTNSLTATGLGLDGEVGREATPEFIAAAADECRRLLNLLSDDSLRSVAIWKMEGYTNEEIAEKLQCVVQTVGRKLRLIRQLWAEEAPQ